MTTAVVVPSNRPERLEAFVEAWAAEFHGPDVRLIAVEDQPEPKADLPEWVDRYTWQDIDELPGSGCIPRRSGGCRAYGFYLAGKMPDVDVILSIDDDVLPYQESLAPIGSGGKWYSDQVELLQGHRNALDTPRLTRWMQQTPFPVRGLPYGIRPGARCVLNHGLWSGVPDVDAYEQLRQGEPFWTPDPSLPSQAVPRGTYFSMCAMNVAFRRELAPMMWFPVLPDGCKRWDDIWCGLVVKRVCDLHGWAVSTGPPFLRHERASKVENNLRQEMLGYGINETLWEIVEQTGRICRAGSPSPLENWLDIWQHIGAAVPQLRETARLAGVWTSLWGGQG